MSGRCDGGRFGLACGIRLGVLYRLRMRLFVTLLLLSAPTLGAAEEYVGVARCKTCHVAQHAHWSKTKHARAHRLLTKAERRDRRCTSCHSTQAESGLNGVQCESCHGAGGHYWPAVIMQDRNLASAVGFKRGSEEQMCRRCHTVDTPSLKPFDYSTALIQTRHTLKPKVSK